MPAKTFFNLNDDRQQFIIDTAIEEFALNDYQNASVTTIVKKLGIAKGSFYRYFKNKKDLYTFLLDFATNKSIDNVKDLLEQPINDFFELIVQNFYMKIKFDMKYPLYSGFLYTSMQERNNVDLGNLHVQNKIRLMVIIRNILVEQQLKGRIRSDIDYDLIAYFIVQIQIGIYDFLSIKYDLDFRENILNKQPVFSISDEEMLKTVRGFSKLMKDGLTNY